MAWVLLLLLLLMIGCCAYSLEVRRSFLATTVPTFDNVIGKDYVTAETFISHNVMECSLKCLELETCQSFVHREQDGMCYIITVRYLTDSSMLSDFTGTKYYTGVKDEGYKLLFRAKAGTGEHVLTRWLEEGFVCDNDSCGDVYKSPLVGAWELGLKAVDWIKIQVSQSNVERAFFLFDGRGSSKTSFMAQSRLVASTSGTLANHTFSFFSVMGHTIIDRTFHIQTKYAGCDDDTGWLIVSEPGNGSLCGWTNTAAKPFFIYCDTKSPCDMKTAPIGDMFSIYGKFAD